MNKDNVKLAIAPIGWTNDDMPELGSENTFQQIVSEMALAGFTGSEVGSKYPRDPAVLKPMLDIRGIQICNAWFSTFFANGQREKTIDEFVNHMNFLHAMGAKVIGCSEQSGSILSNRVRSTTCRFSNASGRNIDIYLQRITNISLHPYRKARDCVSDRCFRGPEVRRWRYCSV